MRLHEKNKRIEPAKYFNDNDDSKIKSSYKVEKIDITDTKIRNSYLYQMFFVRAQQNRLSKTFSFLFIICSIIGTFGLIGFVNPPWKFNELKISEGVMDGYYTRMKSGPSTVKIKNEKGELVAFSIYTDRETRRNIENVRGEFVKIYYCIEIYYFIVPVKFVSAIKYKDIYIMPYSIARYDRELASYEYGKIVFFICTAIGFISLIIIYLRDRKIIK